MRLWKYIEYNIKWKIIYLPFDTLEKPKKTSWLEYEKWRKNISDFILIKNYYEQKLQRRKPWYITW